MRGLAKGMRKELGDCLGGLLREIRKTWRSQKDRPARIVAITHSPHTKLTFRLAAFREDWHFAIATSFAHALELLEKHPAIALIYDIDSGEANWRSVCALAVQRGIGFHLIARNPDDELFLSVIGAGGAGVLSKPLTTEQAAFAADLARSLSEARLANAGSW